MKDANNNDVVGEGVGLLSAPRSVCPNPECGAVGEVEMRNYEMMWHEGDIHCKKCGAFIRRFDAG